VWAVTSDAVVAAALFVGSCQVPSQVACHDSWQQ